MAQQKKLLPLSLSVCLLATLFLTASGGGGGGSTPQQPAQPAQQRSLPTEQQPARVAAPQQSVQPTQVAPAVIQIIQAPNLATLTPPTDMKQEVRYGMAWYKYGR